MIITASELENNLEKYLELAQTQDIFVTKKGLQKIILSSAEQRPLSLLDGVFSDVEITDDEIEDIKWEKLKNV